MFQSFWVCVCVLTYTYIQDEERGNQWKFFRHRRTLPSTSTLGKYDDEVCIIVYFAQEFEMITLHSRRVSALFSSRVSFFFS